MPPTLRSPRPVRAAATRLALPALAAALLAGPALAGDPPPSGPVVYTLNDRGLLSVGGTVLEKLKSKFDPTESPVQFPEQQWVDVAVVGSDRWTLRIDGRVHENGKKIRTLPFESLEGATSWLNLARSDALYALRADGLLARDDDTSVQYPAHSYIFIDVVAPEVDPFMEGPDVFALRTDGGVFGSDLATPGMMLVGGPGVRGDPDTDGALDGQFFDTTWVRLAVDPSTDMVHGLRADGRIHAFDWTEFDASSGVDPGAPSGPFDGGGGGTGEGDPPEGPPEAMEVGALPFPDTLAFTVADLYVDLEFAEDGTFYALRQDGAVFRSDDLENPLVVLPGDGLDPEKVFVDLAVLDDTFFALRFDGEFYDQTGASLIDLQKKRYRRVVISEDPPDLSSFKNRKPVAAVYKPTLLESEAIDLPVIVTDLDTASDELDVQVDLTDLPGASWDAVTRTVSWPGGPAGKYSFLATADDGLLKKPKTFRYKFKVLPMDTVVEKNRPPSPAKVKKVQALVGWETVLPVFATDRDGDELTFTAVDDKGVFARGATFDEETRTITWTPTFDDIGKWSAVILVSDGVKTKKLKVKFTVVNPLIF